MAGNYGTKPRTLTLEGEVRETLLTNLDIVPEGRQLTLPPCGSIVALL